MTTAINAMCVLLLLGWISLALYLRARLRRRDGPSRTPLQDRAHQVWRVARDLAGKLQAWPAGLRPQEAASEYAKFVADEWQRIDAKMQRLPGSLARQETDGPAAGPGDGAPTAGQRRTAG